MRKKFAAHGMALSVGAIVLIILGIIIDASLGSRDERAKYRHFRKLEKRSKDAWIARAGQRY
jgi:hypothetical protein